MYNLYIQSQING